MIKVEVKKTVRGEERVYVSSPFHVSFPAQARALGGHWIADQKLWTFDPRDEQRVRDLCRKIFGTDGNDSVEKVDVRIRLSTGDQALIEDTDELFMLGRRLASRRARDYAVRLDDRTVVVEGGFPGSGGSVRNPRIQAHYGTVLEVRDVPKNLADTALARYGAEVVTILS